MPVTILHPASIMQYHRRPVRFPLTEIWDATGTIAAYRHSEVGAEAIKDLLRSGPVRFAVADEVLRWIPEADTFTFWKAEVLPRLVPPTQDQARLEDYPGDQYYRAEDWRGTDGTVFIVLRHYH